MSEIRRALYEVIFREVNRTTWNGLVTQDSGAAWSLAWRLGIGARMTKAMVHIFRTDDPRAVAQGRERLYEALASLEERHLGKLDAGGFLCGAQPGLSDVAVAALCAPLALPPLFARGKYAQWFNMLHEKDVEMREEVEGFRRTVAGRHCLKVYEATRMVPF